MKMSVAMFASLVLFGANAAYSKPSIDGLVISWPDDGWYQVQTANTYEEVCGGGLFCEVTPGTYQVINHTTGQRFNNVVVKNDSTAEPEENPIVVIGNRISWPNDGWYQVQAVGTYTEVCRGGFSCEVDAGEYIVINHTTGKRYTAIVVDELEPSQPVAIPMYVNATGDGQVLVNWDAVAGASNYHIYVSDQPNVTIGASGVTQFTKQTPPFTLTDAVAGLTYYIAVSAEVNGSESSLSEEVSAQLYEPVMLAVPAGTFTMGCIAGRDDIFETCADDTLMAHNVTVSSFKISETEVTFDQWAVCVEAGGCNGYQPDDGGFGEGDRPVINVSWNDVQTYIAWLKETTNKPYRLPSEAEWEYASRGGSDLTAYHWGNEMGIDNANSNCLDDLCKDRFDDIAPVASFAPNDYGLYDMHGNVWEWVEDCWHDDYTDAPITSVAWNDNETCLFHVFRGGSWASKPAHLLSVYRGMFASTSRGYNKIGFRVALDL